jgi:hypothetical protein
VTDNGEPGPADAFTISVSGAAEESGIPRSGRILITPVENGDTRRGRRGAAPVCSVM